MQKTGTQTLQTDRLTLRPFKAADAEDMFRNWASDPEVTRFLTWPVHSSIDVTRMLLEDWEGRYKNGDYFNWAIEWKESGRVIGGISVVNLIEAVGSAEIGYCLSRAFWGRGIMPEALLAVEGYLFDKAEMNRVCACHDVRNPHSGRVMEKAGLKYEGILRGAGKNNLGICDLAVYAMLQKDWEKKKGSRSEGPVVRFAEERDLAQVNVLRKQVNDLHVYGKPEVFKPGFGKELRDYLKVIWMDPRQKILVAEQDGQVCGFAVLHHICRPESPFMKERRFLDIDEFCVDEKVRRQGIASAMIAYIRAYAREQGYERVELNMWEFNRGALAFYEAAGFTTYRRYMETKV